ncbi:MAG: hypothetical protein GF344_01540, partial [Chitinivibrionales bacterium]|nr:hypothetical protein [Chitinivibrionales bacterium]MBD3355773.1 hypothetical protein [Chitinivibrionales bacterium]
MADRPIHLIASVASAFLFSAYGAAPVFQENNGLVVIEIESIDPANGWSEKTTAADYSGNGYFEWTGSDMFNAPGSGTLTYKVRISSTGTYRFQWRNKVGAGTQTTEHNDSWLRIPDADDFYGKKGGDIVHPKGVCSSDCPEGSGKDGWFKVYCSGTMNWTWSTNTSDNDAHQIYADFNSPGDYTIEISGRSKHHLLDRFVLYKSTVSDPLALSHPQSDLTEGTIDPNPGPSDTEVIKAVDFTTIEVSGFIPYYRDNSNDALAVDASNVNYRDKFAAAQHTFSGTAGTYDITITTLTEIDGESTYRLIVDGSTIGEHQNPTTESDYAPSTHTWENVSLANGDIIQVESNTHTNGEVPEGDGTAWSRGRWRQIEIAPTDTDTTSDPGVYDCGNYRIALSHDGNDHDPDDINAVALNIAIIAESGMKDKFVFMDYSNHIWGDNSDQPEKMRNAVNGACERWQVDVNKCFEVRVPSILEQAKIAFKNAAIE